MNVLATAVAADCGFVTRSASFRSKELTELIAEGIQQPGFSFIDAFSPCTAFNNTTQSWKESVHPLPAEHDQRDRAAAFAAALEDQMTLGVFYRHDRPSLDALVRAMQDAAEPHSLDDLVDGFAVGPRALKTA
jgi:2-oxoglutarate/2-oxoacid ferredoxin oxidoreductase subunit beta